MYSLFSRADVTYPDAGGSVPNFVAKTMMRRFCERVTVIQEYYQALRPFEGWDEDDGIAVGEVFAIKTKAERTRGLGVTRAQARVRFLFTYHRGLRELGEVYPWFEVLMSDMVANKLRPTGVATNKLCNTTRKSASTMGSGLAACLAVNANAKAAVAEWLLLYPAMKELVEKHVWFLPLIETVAQRLLSSVTWGMYVRAQRCARAKEELLVAAVERQRTADASSEQ